MKEEFDALFAEHQKLLGELQAMRAVAKPEQEPVAYLSNKRQRINIELKPQAFVKIPTVTDWEMPLYMKPPQRTWVGLTDEQMQFLATAIGQAKQIIDTYNTEFVTARDDLRRCSELLAAHNIKE